MRIFKQRKEKKDEKKQEKRNRQFLSDTLRHELREQARESARRARRQALILLPILVAVLVVFENRESLFGLGPSADTPVRIVTVIVLVILGWGFARELGRAVSPSLFKRMDPNTAGTIEFLVRVATIVIALIISARVAGLNPETIIAGSAFTAVIVGLAAQQTLGNFIAGTVLISARPFKVGERMRLEGAGIIREGMVSSIGLLWTTLTVGNDNIMVPNSVVMNVAIVPIREPDAVDLRARLRPGIMPSDVQDLLDSTVSIATREDPHIVLEEVDGDEVVIRITATPLDEEEGQQLADEILTSMGQVTSRRETPVARMGPTPSQDDVPEQVKPRHVGD